MTRPTVNRMLTGIHGQLARASIKLLATVFVACTWPAGADAEPSRGSEDIAPVHWAYASLFGTGWYKIKENRSLFVLRVPPRFTVRETEYHSREDRQFGIDLRLPLSIGLHNVDDLPGIIEPDNFGTIAFTPGIEIEIPLSESFLIRPFAHLGWGTEFDSEYSAWIYHVGVKTRYAFGYGRHDLAIIGNFYRAGYRPNEGPSDSMSGLALGVEGKFPLKNLTIAGRPMALDWHVIYTHFNNSPVFAGSREQPDVVQNTMEFGLALSPSEGKWKLFGWQPDRLGLAYQYDPDGKYSALTFNVTSWLRR